MPGNFYRRQLPHLQRDSKAHFLTFCTYRHWVLPEPARSIVLNSCVYEHDRSIDLYCTVVMPDHVHLIFTPLVDEHRKEVCSLARIMNAIKGASAHKINQALHRTGKVWQTESFDHVVRSSVSLDAKVQYLLENPVRKGLVNRWQEYPWIRQKASKHLHAPSTSA
jgi:REP element-mobilizing transposase RayT